MAFAEDLSVFFDTDDFAIAAIFRKAAGGTPTPLPVIMDRAYLEALGMAGTDPAALGMAASFPDPGTVGGKLTIGAPAALPFRGVYHIRTREPQDDGAVVLLQLTLE